jgi:hypothetical protein
MGKIVGNKIPKENIEALKAKNAELVEKLAVATKKK